MRRSLFSVLLVPLASLSLLLSAASGLHAQTFNLQTGREPVASLDGLWRFHTGDNPAWADPNFDDSQWPLLRSDKVWGQQGYENYGGFAWFRFTVAVPEGSRNWSIYLGPMETGYQLFVDGKLAGSFGPILNSRNYAASSRAFALSPAAASGPRTFHIAIRAWHAPVWADYAPGGFLGSSYFGDSGLIAQRAATTRSLQWNGLVDDYTYAVLGTLVGLVVLVLFFIRREEREYLWFAVLLLANAIGIGFNISRLLALIPLPVSDFIDGSVQSAALFAALAFFSVVLRAPRSRTWWLVAALLLLNPTAVFLYVFNISSVGIASLIAALAVLPATVWILVTLLKRSLQGDRDALILLVPTLLWQGFALIDSILLITWQLGWQRWAVQVFPLLTKPFVLMPGPAVGTIFIFALLLFLIRRFSLARQEETRLSSEFESARSIQSLLIPAKPPATPGFAIESVYLPASEVGGDFFQIMPANDGSLLVVVGDVSGKGLKAAMTVSAIIGALRGCAVRKPAEVLAHLNRVLDGQIAGFVTCTGALISADGSMSLANAGNPAPYCNGEELAVESSLPLGIVANSDYSETNYQLKPGDHLTFLSDGVVEATNEHRELFGFDRTRAISNRSASTIAEIAKTFGQQDDITVLTIALAPALEAARA